MFNLFKKLSSIKCIAFFFSSNSLSLITLLNKLIKGLTNGKHKGIKSKL
mgnify:CR=1 FL=1